MKINGWKTACVGVLLGLALFGSGCGQEAEPMEQEIAVEIALPGQGALTLEGRFIGSVSSGEDVSIMPLVSGEITDVYVGVGDKVDPAGSWPQP